MSKEMREQINKIKKWKLLKENIGEGEIIFSDIIDGEVRVYEGKLRELFGFVGDGIYDIDYDLKHNHVWIQFEPSPIGYIELSDWNKVESIVKDYIAKYGQTHGLDDYRISFKLDLYFNPDYPLGIY